MMTLIMLAFNPGITFCEAVTSALFAWIALAMIYLTVCTMRWAVLRVLGARRA